MSSKVELVTLESPKNQLQVQLIEQGLHVYSISFDDKDGKKQEIIIGPEDPKDQIKDRRFLHPIIGRYCNRLPSNSTPLSLPNGKTFTPEEFGGPGTSLHGGPPSSGWDQKQFKPLSFQSAQLFSSEEKTKFSDLQDKGQAGVWSYTSRDGEGGYPGTVLCETAIFVLPSEGEKEVGSVGIVYRAELVDGELTPLNLTHHWAFNLEASDKGRNGPGPFTDVLNHTLHIKSTKNLDLNPSDSLPTGKLVPPPPGRDFSSPKKIGKDYPSGGLDDFWVFQRGPGGREVYPKEENGNLFEDMNRDDEVVAILSSDTNGLSLEFTTNSPGVQAWSGTGGYDGQDSRRKIHGGKAQENIGDGYNVPPAFAMEFHSVYDAWRHEDLKGLGWDTILKKGEVYNHWVKMTIKSE